jgi:DNA modification methylase
VILTEQEEEIYHNVMRKDAMARRLRVGLIEQIQEYEKGELKIVDTKQTDYIERTETGKNWTAMLGDSCKRLAEIADNSIDLSVYSPPFIDLYTYTDSERDLGNSHGADEFYKHYGFIIREVLRVTKPGRVTCVHTSDIPAMAQRDGYIGVKDFPGEVIRAHEAAGWVFVGRAFVQKNPQAQAIRTKSKALLFVQLRKDAADSRPALVDQILIFKKPGENAVPVLPVDNGELDNETWIEWAHGIWLGIHESDTLRYASARGADDEKHICPLQLGTIERCVKLYSNPGETVLTPFLGIGSEAYESVRLGRRAIGIELKQSYYETAVKNLAAIEADMSQPTLLDLLPDESS